MKQQQQEAAEELKEEVAVEEWIRDAAAGNTSICSMLRRRCLNYECEFTWPVCVFLREWLKRSEWNVSHMLQNGWSTGLFRSMANCWSIVLHAGIDLPALPIALQSSMILLSGRISQKCPSLMELWYITRIEWHIEFSIVFFGFKWSFPKFYTQ